jgi:hypothetical protein
MQCILFILKQNESIFSFDGNNNVFCLIFNLDTNKFNQIRD